MTLGQCACPECGTALRVRDRSFIGRQIPCPDCQTTILITLNGSGDLVAAQATSTADKAADRGPSASAATSVAASSSVKTSGRLSAGHHPQSNPTGRGTKGYRKQPANSSHVTDINDSASSPSRWKIWLANVAASPLTLAWLLAISLIAFLLIIALRPSVRFQSPRPMPKTETPSDVEKSPSDNDKRSGTPLPADQHVLPAPTESTADAAVGPVPASAVTPVNVVPPTPSDSNPITVVKGNGNEPAVGQQVNKADVTPKEPVPPPIPQVDIGASLAQRIISFKQSKPVPRRDVLELLEEMIGVPVRFDAADLGKERLDQPITLELENTTIEGILRAVADAAQWQFSTEKDCIRISRKNDGAASK